MRAQRVGGHFSQQALPHTATALMEQTGLRARAVRESQRTRHLAQMDPFRVREGTARKSGLQS